MNGTSTPKVSRTFRARELSKELKKIVRENLGSIVIVDDVLYVKKLPKTRSGKIMRRLIKAVITNQLLIDYSTIEDETSIEEIKRAIKYLGK